MLRIVNLIVAIILFLASLLFLYLPQLDVTISSYFFIPGKGFIYANNLLVQILFRAVPILTTIYVCFLIFSLLKTKLNNSWKEVFRQKTFILLLSCIIGPGFIVNYCLKDHFGRARPRQVLEFEGTKKFYPVYYKVVECHKNCSFSSGHAASAFNFSSIAYIVPGPYKIVIFIGGVIFGLMVGIGRIIQGGHFASDVLVSGWIVLLLNLALFIVWKYFNKVDKPEVNLTKEV